MGALFALAPTEKKTILALLRAHRDDDIHMRLLTEKALDKLGSAAVPTIIAALTHDDVKLRANAAFRLGRIIPVDKEAVAPLTIALKDKEISVRRSAAGSLGHFGDAAEIALPAWLTVWVPKIQLCARTRPIPYDESVLSWPRMKTRSPL